MSSLSFDQVSGLVASLSEEDKVRLIGELSRQILEARPDPQVPGKRPYRSLWGALKHLGPAPSAEEIDEVRREVWKNFPREDV